MAIVVMARKLRPYFQDHKVLVKTNYPVWQILKKPNPPRRMISWAVELYKYDIQYALAWDLYATLSIWLEAIVSSFPLVFTAKKQQQRNMNY